MRCKCLFLGVALLTITVAGSVMAIPPDVVVYPVPISDNLGSCGEFDVLREAEYTITETTFFLESGEVDRITLRFDGTETFINSETGFALAGMPFHGSLVVTSDREGNPVQLTRGFLLGGHVPGLGMVLLNAGNVTYDLSTVTITFQHGTFDNLFFSDDEPQLEALCDALRGSMKPDAPKPTWGRVKRLYR